MGLKTFDKEPGIDRKLPAKPLDPNRYQNKILRNLSYLPLITVYWEIFMKELRTSYNNTCCNNRGRTWRLGGRLKYGGRFSQRQVIHFP